MSDKPRVLAGAPDGGRFTTSPKGEADLTLARPEPTPDQTYCDFNMHQQCSGYTEDEADPESCMCECHNPQEHR